MNQT
jgi:hypothetical protein